MYVKLTTARNVSHPLLYNEEKVNKGNAEILDCVNFFKDPSSLTLEDKLAGFKRLTSLNTYTKVNTLHISLNFHPSENLLNDKLVSIADSYMEQLGFAAQPYIVYRHNDAGHPHIHLVSCNIDSKGKHIKIRRSSSESVRAKRLIEKKYGLINEFASADLRAQTLKSSYAGKLIYGKSAIQPTIERILLVVLNQYRFVGIADLNAVLQQYNVFADRGQPNSRMFNMGGIVYRTLDQNGKKIGCPIKASSFATKPTLKNLEKLFQRNEQFLISYKSQIIAKIKWALPIESCSIEGFVNALKKEGIDVIFKKDSVGKIQSLTYIDQANKTVFSESALDKDYAAKAILKRFTEKQVLPTHPISLHIPQPKADVRKVYSPIFNIAGYTQKISRVFALLMTSGAAPADSPADLPMQQRKKRKKGVHRS